MPAACLGGRSMSGADEKAAWLRQNLPVVAGVVDEFAAVFGRENIRVVHAAENGHEFGKRGPDGVKLSETNVGPLALKARK